MSWVYVNFPLPDSLSARVQQTRERYGSAAISEPHVTCAIVDTYASISEIASSLDIRSSPIELHSSRQEDWGPYQVSLLERTVGLFGVHLQVLDCLEGHIAAPLEETPEDPDDPARVEQWRRYGSVNFGRFYQPHLTLSKNARSFVFKPFSFVADHLVVARSEDGSYVDSKAVYFR